MNLFFIALLVSLFAGLSTTLGCIIAIFFKKPSPTFLSVSLGFSAGVMILVSFIELLPEGINDIGFVMALVYFFIGMSIALIIDITVSHKYKLEETIELIRSENGCSKEKYIMHRHKYQHGHSNDEHKVDKKMEKTSKLLFLGIFIHNIPEGMATFISTTESIQLGTIIALAIALHNIPEGISVSAPIYYCTNSKKKAFFWTFLSGISEFLGALLIGLILWPFINKYLLGAMLSIVAGLMIYISLDELLPVSRSLGKEHHSILGIMIGMIVMAFTYVLILN